MSLKRKVFNQCVVPAMIYECQTWSLTNALVQKLETSKRALGRKMLSVKLKDGICNTIIKAKSERHSPKRNQREMVMAGDIA